MIEIKNIDAGYSSKKILKNISCNIAKESFTGIIGKNAAGKSTLLKVLCGILKPFSGQVLINGHNVYTASKKFLSETIAFMPQNVDMNFPFTVKEFVMFGRYPYMNMFKMPSEKDYAAVDEILKFTGIETFSQRYVDELSGGEKQKVLIAQTIAQETDIMVFDEPASHLDIGSLADILHLLRLLNKKHGRTIVVTLHDLNAAGEFCDNLILMEDGNIRNSGNVEKVLNYKDIEEVYKTTVVVKTNPISGKPYIIPVSKDLQ
ncbi:MAG: ABC transporter ATP-binding protein [Endomicrobium sp.]|jgi:iron complex transport system ATP-binding protein|nr:ABC transporter ATP-binding protein [Endomicrobium sp.]